MIKYLVLFLEYNSEYRLNSGQDKSYQYFYYEILAMDCIISNCDITQMIKLTGKIAYTHFQFSTLQYSHLIHQFYTSQSIQQRIQAIKQLPEHLPLSSISNYKIEVPSKFTMTNAKSLLQYHKDNKTPININILHALAFIELNAFQAYADTFLRFTCNTDQPNYRQLMSEHQLNTFKLDIKTIALDEAEHCRLLSNRIKQLGFQFGQIPVISSLSNVVEQTKHSLLERLALISIVHEGRGMKAVSKLVHKIQNCKDDESVKILKLIQSEEGGHFRAGLKWFKYFLSKKIDFQLSQNGEAEDLSTDICGRIQDELKVINEKYKVKISLEDIRIRNTGKA